MITVENGSLKTFTGDSYQLNFDIKGLAPVCLYKIYFQINKSQPLIKYYDLTTDDNGNGRAVFDVSVEENKESGRFTYGVKACRDNQEDTIKTGIINVCSLAVEGTVNG